jgi:hypothetical protein
MTDLPRLFPWGRDGTPGEFDSFLDRIDLAAREQAGEDVSSIRNRGYAEKGVEALAERLLHELRDQRGAARGKKGLFPKLTFEIRSWTYLLSCYCAKWNRPAPPTVLRLIFEALALKEGQASPAVRRRLGTPEEAEKLPAFLEAAKIDGEADAAGAALDVAALARAVEVERATIRRWRETEAYKRRRRAVAYVHGKYVAPKGGN